MLTTLLAFLLFASPALADAAPGAGPDLSVHDIRYDGVLTDSEARFAVELNVECASRNGGSLPLFAGEVAVLPARLPAGLQLIRTGDDYVLTSDRAGRFSLRFDLVAKIQRAEPWNQVRFTGPPAAIASVSARASGPGMEVQLLSGTLVESVQASGEAGVRGLLGSDRVVALSWQGKVTEVARKALITAETTASAQVTPTVIKFVTQIRYDIVQGRAARLVLALPPAHALTRLAGEQIRDWQIKPDGDRQLLTVEFIKPVEKGCVLTLYSEQPVGDGSDAVRLDPPQPLEIERESGSFTLSAEDMVAETESVAGLRQVNASSGALAAYRFNARPFTLTVFCRRIEPVVSTADRVSARLEETRLLVSHRLTLNVEKAGIYAIEFTPPAALAVTDVRGEGVEDWTVNGGRLRVNFQTRVLGTRKLEIQLEEALKHFPDTIHLAPLPVVGAVRQTAQIGAGSAPGIRLKTSGHSGLREIPANRLPERSDELLAFTAEKPDWKLALACERLAPRIVADVFNLVTVGDGLVGGSATIRYGIINQGVQEFQVKVPPYCRNVEFTGPNIRRKELAGDVWTIGLQDKVWGGYTLVVTYDYQFDPKGAPLPVAGIHTPNVERETGSVAVTTAASLKLTARTVTDPLRRVDETELSASDRALVTRAVVLAYQYTGGDYTCEIEAQRHDELPVLEAVADRTQITSVLTEAGEMLTQASFMVKNNAKQSQRFKMPAGADFWGCYVNGEPAKPERDGDWVLVPLPRAANRDQAFAVDIVYAEKKGALHSRWPHSLALTAPRTDVPNTYAEWELYVPASQRLSAFAGSMSVAQGTTYGLLDAWEKFLAFYLQVIREAGRAILIIGLLAFVVIGLVISAARRGANGVITLLVVLAIMAVLAGMLLPALSKAKARAQRINSVNNLKQIGVATRSFAMENGDRLPVSFEEMMNELNTDKVTYDVETGQRFVYLGGGLPVDSLTPDSVIAYSPLVNGHCNVLFVDGSVSTVSANRFAEYSQRGLIQYARPEEMAARKQGEAVTRAQHPSAVNWGTMEAAGRGIAVPESAAVSDISGFSAGSAVVAAPPPPAPVPVAAPLARGLRSIRIEIPREGHAFLFTKVLTIGAEPLSIRAQIMSLHAFQTLQMLGQVAAFLAGLAAWWWQWRREQPNTFILTGALALILVSVASLLVAWRALHDALIVGFPMVVLGLVAWLIWKSVSRRRRQNAVVEQEPPPLAAAIVLLFALSVAGVQAGEPPVTAPETPAVSILSASYSGTVNDRVARIDATLRLFAAKPDQTVPLFGGDVAIGQFNVKSGRARLVSENGVVCVRLERRGDVTLQVHLVAKISGDVTKRRLAFNLPSALSSQVALTLDQGEADVDFPSAISFKRSVAGDQTRVDAVIGSAGRVDLSWTPRMKRADEVAATVFCQNSSLVTLGGGVMGVRAVLDYQVTQGELRQARVRLPAGHRLLRVEGESIRTWEIKEADGAQTLVVDLLKGMSPAYRLTVETEKAMETPPVSVSVEIPNAMEVKRESGLVALRGAEELTLSVESTRELQRVDTDEFSRAANLKTDGVTSVFRFLKPGFELRTRAELVQPQIEAVVQNNVRVATDQVTLSAVIHYTIKRAGVFVLRLAVPPDYRVEQVHGANIAQWSERTDADGHVVEVTLKERTGGRYSLRLELGRNLRELPKTLVIAGVQPLGLSKLTGYISALAEPGVALKTEAFDGLTEIPAVALPDATMANAAGGALAFKYLGRGTPAVQAWSLAVATEAVEPWLRAEIATTFTLTEALVSGRAVLRYDIANAPVKALLLRVPEEFKNVEITGPNIRRRDLRDGVWEVELQNKIRGSYTLAVTWEQPRADATGANVIELTGVSAAGVERETGFLAVVAKTPLQVGEVQAAGLQRVDPHELPEWTGRRDDATVLAYRYARPGCRLTLEARRFDEAQVLQGLVDSARLTTVVADDGQAMTEMALLVRNNGRQFLEVELPAGSTVWSAFVGGQPVRPSRRDGKLLLPLQERGTGDEGVSVNLTYVGTMEFPQIRGKVNFESPKFDVPLKNAQWELYLPPDYSYDDYSGTMVREAQGRPSLLNFGLSDYTLKERESRAAYRAEMEKDVSQAQSNLSSGNVREAVNFIYNSKSKWQGADEDKSEVTKLEQQLGRVQADNLINAQRAFSMANAAPAEEAPRQRAAGNEPSYYDNAAAQAQWSKLAQAQEVAVTAVQPLHVNLPLRGLRYAFNQVLQTEVNKPMTVRLTAVNSRTGNWLGRLGAALAGFAMLWVLVAVVTARRHRQ